MKPDFTILAVVGGGMATLALRNFYQNLDALEALCFILGSIALLFVLGSFAWLNFSQSGGFGGRV